MKSNLRVWHIPQVPGKAFYVPVDSPEEGIKIMDILSYYDLFQLEHRIKPDYSNVCGLEMFVDGEWTNWENELAETEEEFRDRLVEDGKYSPPDYRDSKNSKWAKP
jgi:hypothetical protein